jgi:hypothetical protein
LRHVFEDFPLARRQSVQQQTVRRSLLARSWDATRVMPPNSFNARRRQNCRTTRSRMGTIDAIEALLKHEGNLRAVIDEVAHDPT